VFCFFHLFLFCNSYMLNEWRKNCKLTKEKVTENPRGNKVDENMTVWRR